MGMSQHFDQYGFLYNGVTISILKWMRQNSLRVNSTKSEIAKQVESTQSHVSKTLEKLSGAELVDLSRQGQAYNCSLTDEGEDVADAFIATMEEIEQKVTPDE